MNLAQLRALVAVADEGSFTRAAGVLGITQPAVSHAVAALEREVGHQLIDRDRTGVTLTAVGRAVVDEARTSVRAADRVAHLAVGAGAELAGELRVAGLASTDVAVLPALLKGFRRLHPLSRVTLLEGSDEEVLDWVLRGVVDLGCVTALGDVVGPLLAVDEYVAVVDPEHPLAGEPDVSIDELTDDVFIASSGGCEPFLQALFAEAGVDFKPTHRVNQLTTMLTMVRCGMGVTVLPSLLLEDGPQDLVALPLRPRVPRSVFLAHRRSAAPHPLGQALLALVTETGPVEATLPTARRERLTLAGG